MRQHNVNQEIRIEISIIFERQCISVISYLSIKESNFYAHLDKASVIYACENLLLFMNQKTTRFLFRAVPKFLHYRKQSKLVQQD